jgi:hypothetical protein
VAKETGKRIPVIALNWLLQRPTVANIVIGARNEEQLRQNLEAVGWNLTPEQVAKLDQASDRAPIYPYWHQRQFIEEPFAGSFAGRGFEEVNAGCVAGRDEESVRTGRRSPQRLKPC